MIPFFDSQQWIGKKYLDFIDFKSILSLKEKGHHYSKEGKILINLILSHHVVTVLFFCFLLNFKFIKEIYLNCV